MLTQGLDYFADRFKTLDVLIVVATWTLEVAFRTEGVRSIVGKNYRRDHVCLVMFLRNSVSTF